MIMSRLADMQLLYHDKDNHYLFLPQASTKNRLIFHIVIVTFLELWLFIP